MAAERSGESATGAVRGGPPANRLTRRRLAPTTATAARNVVTKTEEWLTPISLHRVQRVEHLRSAGDHSAAAFAWRERCRVSEVQRELWLHLLAPVCAGRPALFGDPFLWHSSSFRGPGRVDPYRQGSR